MRVFIGRLKARLRALQPGVSIGSKTIFEGSVYLRKSGGRITIGRKCHFYHGAQILGRDGDVVIGNGCSINANTVLYGQGGLRIGDGVRIAANTVIVPSNHRFDSTDIPIFQQGFEAQGIEIKDDVWIGANCTVLDGVTIAQGCIIGAGSTVTKSTEPFGIYVGSPAKLLISRKS